MIGGLSRAATSILRQLIDAGTLSNLPGGFKARGVRIRNDDEPVNPGEFRDLDAPGGDIRNAIIPFHTKNHLERLPNFWELLLTLVEDLHKWQTQRSLTLIRKLQSAQQWLSSSKAQK